MKKNIATILLLSFFLSGCGGSSDSSLDNSDTDNVCSDASVDCDSDTDTVENLGAQILDTLTTDTGELRIDINSVESGTLTATVQLQEDADTVVPDTAASIKSTGYITLSNGSAEVAEIILSSGAVKYRDSSDSQVTIDGLTYSEGDELEVVVDWDASGYTISLDGGVTSYGPYVGSAAVDGVNPAVDRLSFRLSDTSAQSQHELNVDNIVIAEDNLSESFSSDAYSEGDDLLSTYSSNGSEATVQIMDFSDEADDDTDTDTDANLGAQVLDTLTTDTGELRIDLNDLATGTLTTSVQLQEDADTVVPDTAASIKSTGYITLSNGSAEVAEIILSSGDVKYRDSSDSQVTIDGLTYNEGDELEVVVDWDTSGYSFSIDGGVTNYGPYVGSAAVDGVNPVVDRLSFRLADTSAQSQHEFNIDKIVITEDDLSESFSADTYSVDEDLLTTYSSNGSEATVQELDFAE